MTDWTEKYRPSSLSEVRGNDKARDALRDWAESWPEHKEAVVLHGSPGVGKTSAAHALAEDKGWEVIELNASDQRTADVIERVAGEAANSASLTGGGRKLVILDEADNLHGTYDRGGAAAVTRLVKDAGQPVVLIANDYYEMGQGLRGATQEIEFRDVGKRSIVPVLRDICRREDIEYDDAALDALAAKNSGDLRSAVNDLQALAENDRVLSEEDVVTGERDRTTGIFDFLDALIKEEDAEGALKASYDVEETPDDLLNWVDENVPKDYRGAELADAYDALSKADVWLGRVRATQNYSYWRYATDNITAGVAAARGEEKGGWTRYGPPSYWSKLGRTKGSRDTRDYIARKIAERSGCSMATARREVMPFLAAMTHHCKPRDLTVEMAAVYDLEEEHVAYVTGSGETTNKVESIVADAEERRAEAMAEHAQGAFEGTAGADAPGEDEGTAGVNTPDDDGEMAETAEVAPETGDEGKTENAADEGDEPDDDGQSQSGLGDFM